MDCSLPGSSVLGIFKARVLEWGAIAFSVVRPWPCAIIKAPPTFQEQLPCRFHRSHPRTSGSTLRGKRQKEDTKSIQAMGKKRGDGFQSLQSVLLPGEEEGRCWHKAAVRTAGASASVSAERNFLPLLHVLWYSPTVDA